MRRILVGLLCLGQLATAVGAAAAVEQEGPSGPTGQGLSVQVLPGQEPSDLQARFAALPPLPASELTAPLAPGDEVAALRTATSRTVAGDEPGVYDTTLYTGPVHWRTAAGEWLAIDNRWVTVDPTGLFEGGSDRVRPVVDLTGAGPLASVALGENASFGFDLVGRELTAPFTVDGDTIRVAGVLEGVDLELIDVADGLKEFLVLEGPEAPDTFTFDLQLHGLSPVIAGDGSVKLVDSSGTGRGLIPAPWAEDASGHADGVTLLRGWSLTPSGSGLVLQVDREWLDDPARQWPVRVDPSVSYWSDVDDRSQYDDNYRMDTWVHSGQPNNDFRSFHYLWTGATGSGDEYQTYFKFGDSANDTWVPMEGSHYVYEAYMDLWNNYSEACQNNPDEDRWVYLKRITEANWWNDDSITYNDKPTWDTTDIFGAHYATHGTNCDGGAAFVTFGNNSIIYGDGGHSERDDQLDDYARRLETGLADYGFTVIGSTNAGDAARSFYSFDHPDSARRPQLRVRWQNQFPSVGSAAAPGDYQRLNVAPSTLAANVFDAETDDMTAEFQLFYESGSTPLITRTDTSVPVGPSGWATASVSTSGVAWADGLYRWTVVADDGRDASATETFYFELDRTAPATPTVYSWTHPTQADWYPSTDPAFGWSSSDTGSGITNYRYRIDGGGWNTVGYTTTSASYTNRSEGSHTFEVQALDAAGNWSPTGSYTIKIDATAPGGASITSPSHHGDGGPADPPSQWSKNRNVTFELDAPSDLSGIAGWRYQFNTDPADVPQSHDPLAGSTITLQAPPEGIVYLHARTENGAGLLSDATSRFPVMIDALGPSGPSNVRSTSGHVPNEPSTEPVVEMAWDGATDAASGVSGYSWTFNSSADAPADAEPEGDVSARSATSAPMADGAWYFHVRAIDAAGNLGQDQVYGPVVIAGQGDLPPVSDLIEGLYAQSDELGIEKFYALTPMPDLGPDVTGWHNLRTGNAILQLADTTIPGHGLNIDLRYSYNLQNHRAVDDGLGLGWRLSFGDATGASEFNANGVDATAALNLTDITTHLPDGSVAAGTVFDFVDGDGTTHRFLRDPKNPARWISPPGVDLVLTAEVTRNSDVPARFEFTRPDGVAYIAEQTDDAPGDWRITRIQNRAGDALLFQYGLVGTDVRLTGVWHNRTGLSYYSESTVLEQPPAVELVWLPDGRLDRVITMPDDDTFERVTDFTVHPTSRFLTAVTTRATHPEARTTKFSYTVDQRIQAVSSPAAPNTDPQAWSTFAVDTSEGRFEGVTDREGNYWDVGYVSRDGEGFSSRTRTRTPMGVVREYTISPRQADATKLQVAGGNPTAVIDRAVPVGDGTTTTTAITSMTWLDNRLTQATDAEGAATTYSYDALGQVTRIVAPAVNDSTGRPQPFPDDAHGGTVVTDLTYEYGGERHPGACLLAAADDRCNRWGQPIRIFTGGHTRNTTIGYDPYGRPATVTTAGAYGSIARRTRYEYYGTVGPLKAIYGPGYDDDTPFLGDRPVTFGAPEAQIDDLDQPWGYDRTGQPLSVFTNNPASPNGGRTTYTYSPYGPTLTMTDAEGGVYATEYDARDLPVATVLPTLQNGPVRRSSIAYNLLDLPVTSTSAEGLSVTIDAYDLMGRVTLMGHALATTAQTATVEARYDLDGRVVWTDDERDQRTYRSYHPNGWPSQVSAPSVAAGNAETSYEYDKVGRRVRVRGAATVGMVRPETRTDYSAAGLPVTVTVTSPSGQLDRITRFAYDAHGQQIQTLGPRPGSETLVAYNGHGQLETRHVRVANGPIANNALTTTITYNPDGTRETSTRPGSNGPVTTTYGYDQINQLTTRTESDRPGYEVTYAYDGVGRQIKREERDGGQFRDFVVTYNPDGSVQQMYADANLDSSGYDAPPLAVCAYQTDPADGYDRDGRPTALRLLTGVSNCANSPGNSMALRVQTLGYDDAGRLDSYTQQLRARTTDSFVTRAQSYTHHATGQIATATDSSVGTVTYGLTPGGMTTTITDWRGRLSTIDYERNGAVRRWDLGKRPSDGTYAATGIALRNLDGSLGRLSWQRTLVGSQTPDLIRDHYGRTHDIDGTLTRDLTFLLGADGTGYDSANTTHPQGLTGVFNHDVAGRLIRAVSPLPFDGSAAGQAGDDTYTYDSASNLTDIDTVVNNTLRSHTTNDYTNDRMLSTTTDDLVDDTRDATTSFGYNEFGDQRAKEVYRNGGDLDAKTTNAVGSGSFVTHVEHDPDGNGPTATTDIDYVYDLTEELVARRTDTGDTRLYFTWGPGGPLSQIVDATGTTATSYLTTLEGQTLAEQNATGDWSWLLPDDRGNVGTQLRDQTQAGADDATIIGQSEFTPYGEDLSTDTQLGQVTALLGFQGDPVDEITGNVLIGRRQYDPTTARFTTTDLYQHAGLDAGLSLDPLTGNRFIYAAASPIGNRDDGHRFDANDRWYRAIDQKAHGERALASAFAAQPSPALSANWELFPGSGEARKMIASGRALEARLRRAATLGPGPTWWDLLRMVVDVGGLATGFMGALKAAGAGVASAAGTAPEALPAARQVEATWGPLNRYSHGTGPMTAIQHINYRHAFNSGFADVSRFAQNTSVSQIRSYVDEALRYGTVSQNGASVVHDLGRTIGFDRAGNAVSGLQVWIRDGYIRTAFPVAP